MKKIVVFAFFFFLSLFSFSQSIEDSISRNDTKEILFFLSSDSMKGRTNFSPEQEVAAIFIKNWFSKNGLQSFIGLDSFYHRFMVTGVNKNGDSAALKNVIAMLPGNKYPNELVIFSAHYDHIKGHTIYNGANDNASGTTAVLLLAKYFAMRKDNERTIVFCLFAGEELGMLGSTAFVRTINPETIKAVINIEMIGAVNSVGRNAFFITGSYKSDLRKIIKKNLGGTGVKLRAEGSDPKQLFMRSDNYPFAKLGIPAHTIMCSNDDDPCYHQPCDDAERIDIENMTRVIQAIAKSSGTIISGKETPKKIRL